MVFNLCTLFDDAINPKFHKNISRIMVLVLCTLSDNVLYLYQVSPNISKGFRVTARTGFLYGNLHKGRNSAKKSEGGVKVLALGTASDDVLYLYQVSQKYLKELFCGHDLQTKFYKGHNSAKNIGGVTCVFFFVLCKSSDDA